MKNYKIIFAAIIVLIILGLVIGSNGKNLQGALRSLKPQIKPIGNLYKNNFLLKENCNQKVFKAAFIILYQSDEQLTDGAKFKMSAIKNEFANAFSIATNNLASINIDPEVYTLKVDKNLFIGDSSNFEDEFLTYGTIIKQFYSNHKDIYDQLFLGLTWGDASTSWHVTIKNDVLNIGINNSPDHSAYYGTTKLHGYIQIPNLNRLVYPADGLYANTLLHEMGHQWCCYAGDNFSGNNEAGKIEIKQDDIHFYQGLASPYETQTPMNAKKWVPNGDGTFHTDESLTPTHTIQKYHPIMLYFMGLLPKSEYPTKFGIYNAGTDDPGNYLENFNYDSAPLYKEVSVNDIINATGERKCK